MDESSRGISIIMMPNLDFAIFAQPIMVENSGFSLLEIEIL